MVIRLAHGFTVETDITAETDIVSGHEIDLPDRSGAVAAWQTRR